MEEKGEESGNTIEKLTIQLKSSDGEIFEVKEAVVIQSQILKDFIAMDTLEGHDSHVPSRAFFPLPQVPSKILAKVIEYCNYHFDKKQKTPRTSEEEIKAWDTNFMKVDLEILYDILLAANYLDITNLMALTSKSIYDLKANGRTPVEVCKTFYMREDLNSMESKQIESGEDAWAFDKINE